MSEESLGVYAYAAKNIFSNTNYLCLFTQTRLLVLEDKKMDDYLEDIVAPPNQSFFSRVKAAFQAGSISHKLSENKMINDKAVRLFDRKTATNVQYDRNNNKLSFYDLEEEENRELCFDYDTESLLIYIRKIFGIVDKNIS